MLYFIMLYEVIMLKLMLINNLIISVRVLV